MISNAVILARSSRVAGASGKLAWGSATSLEARCFLDVPTRKQRSELGATIENATAVAFVLKSNLATALRGNGFTIGDKLSLKVDGGNATDHEVISQANRQKDGGLAHFEVFLKVL